MILEHLKNRYMDITRYNIAFGDDDLVYFYLFNLSGMIVGYQQYRMNAEKMLRNDPKSGRYYTYRSPENKGYYLAVWGLETINYRSDVLFIVEGIFDAVRIHNAGYPAIACLSNNPKELKNWLSCLNRTIIVIYDNDSSGKLLAKYGKYAFTVPNPYKDLGEMPETESTAFLNQALTTVLNHGG